MLKVVPVQASSPDLISLLEATGAGLFWHANEEDICCMQMRGPQLRADRFFFFFLPCPRHFCCCLTGFPGDLDQHFHNRVSKVSLPHPAIQGQPGQQVRLPGAVQTAQPWFLPLEGEGEGAAGGCKGSAPPSTEFTLSQADSRDLLGEKLARGHQPGQPRSRFVVLRY